MNRNSALLDRARLLLEQGRPADAIREVRRLLELEPENEEALGVYARCLFDGKEFEKGLEVVQEAIRLRPDNGFYFYLFGFGCYRMDRNSEAITHLQTAVRLDPYQPEFFGMLAFVYLSDLNFAVALEKADEGLALDPENITCLNARSTALNKLSRTDDAIETMKGALAKDPDNEFTHTTIGWNYLEKGRHKLAMHHFREALRIDPAQHNAKIGLKEALKSKIAPYRWLLQFKFWLSNKGSRFRWVFVIGIYLSVRAVMTITRNSKDYQFIGFIVGGAYFLFVATSWIINPLANLFLLFHRDGKHALDVQEKRNALGFLACVLLGIGIMFVSATYPKESSAVVFGAGLVMLSACIPAGHLRLPVRFNRAAISQMISIGMLVMAVVIVVTALAWAPDMNALFVIYAVLFVIFTWTSSF